MNSYQLQQGDCLELMAKLPARSVDLVLCDLPYGMTDFSWDKCVSLPDLWNEYRRVLKPCGLAVLFAAQSFALDLAASARPLYRYSLTWIKNQVTNPQNAKYQPLRRTEQILVFTTPRPDNRAYFPKTRDYMLKERAKSGKTTTQLQALLGSCMTSHYFTSGGQFILPHEAAYTKLQSTGAFPLSYAQLRAMYEEERKSLPQLYPTYNPQGLKPHSRARTRNPRGAHDGFGTALCSQDVIHYEQKQTGYPDDLLYFDVEPAKERVHPTQKPVDLLEWLIKTYSNEGETVLDNCMGSGSTGIACLKTGRRFIGMELDPCFFEIAQSRLGAAERMAQQEA